jgi:membrane protease YdiL (CAAX protease family)
MAASAAFRLAAPGRLATHPASRLAADYARLAADSAPRLAAPSRLATDSAPRLDSATRLATDSAPRLASATRLATTTGFAACARSSRGFAAWSVPWPGSRVQLGPAAGLAALAGLGPARRLRSPHRLPAPWQPAQWPFFSPPPAPLVPPGKLHPPTPPRPIVSTQGRAAPRLYIAGWLLTVAGIAGLAGTLLAISSSSKGIGLAGFLSLEACAIALSAGFIAAALAQGRQRVADGWQDYSGPSPFLLIGAWVALSMVSSLALEGLLEVMSITIADSVLTLVAVAMNLVIYVALVQATVIRTGVLTWADMARPDRLAPHPSDQSFSWSTFQWTKTAARNGPRALLGDLAVGIGLGVPLMVGTLFYTGILALVLGLRDVEVPPGPVPTHLPGWDLWIILLAAGVIAPIGEEIFFRGFATNAWGRSLARNSAIWLAAIVFASVHIINVVGEYSLDELSVFLRLAILAVAARIPVAWALSWIYTRRHSIYSSMALHAAYNGCLVLLVWWVYQIATVGSR